jgi:hypothetical protein
MKFSDFPIAARLVQDDLFPSVYEAKWLLAVIFQEFSKTILNCFSTFTLFMLPLKVLRASFFLAPSGSGDSDETCFQ